MKPLPSCHSVSSDCVDWWAHYCRAPRSMSICSRTSARSVIGCHLIVCISGNKYICKTNKQKYLPPHDFLTIRKEAGLLVKCRWRWSARFLWDRHLPEVLTWGSTLRAGDWCIHSKHGAKRSSCSFFTCSVNAERCSWGMWSQTRAATTNIVQKWRFTIIMLHVIWATLVGPL